MNKYYGEFRETKTRFEAAIEAVEPKFKTDKSFTVWNSLPLGIKAPALFVMYYDQIILWYTKLDNKSIPDSEVVSVLVDKFLNVAKTLTVDTCNPKYMSTIIKNALITMYRLKYNRSIYHDTNVSNTAYSECDEDDFGDNTTYSFTNKAVNNDYDIISQITAKNIAKALNSYKPSETAKSLIDYYMGYKKSVPKAQSKNIPDAMKELRDVFRDTAFFADVELVCKTFEDVIMFEDLIDKAVILMKDGRGAYYTGEKEVTPNGRIRYICSVGERVYYIPRAKLADYKVVKIILAMP